MNHSAPSNSWLIADIGATSCRCGIYTFLDKTISGVHVYRNDDFGSFQELLVEYLGLCRPQPEKCALAVAAPVDGDHIQMINRNWKFSGTEIATQFGFHDIEIVNDFHALAYGLPNFGDEDRFEIGRASVYRKGNIAVIGPGSGLGMSAWIEDRSTASVMRGEGGHVTLASRDAAEDLIIGKIRNRFGHCSAERVISGPGLIALHLAMHNIEIASPEEITGNPDDPHCAATLNQFFRFLGSAAADLALITGAYGGVYIAGGIVPACLTQIESSDFRSRFEDKNRYVDYMQSIPTWVITAREPGLIGLAAFIDQHSDQGS